MGVSPLMKTSLHPRLGLLGLKSKLHDQYEQTRIFVASTGMVRFQGEHLITKTATNMNNFATEKGLTNPPSKHLLGQLGPKPQTFLATNAFMSKNVAEIAEGLHSLDQEVRMNRKQWILYPIPSMGLYTIYGSYGYSPWSFRYSVSQIAI